MNEASDVFDVRNLKVYFPLAQPFSDMVRGLPKKQVRAVDGVTFRIHKAEILSLVGESGSGKSTVGKSLLKLIDDKYLDGEVLFEGKDLRQMEKSEISAFRQRAQMIFQDPYQSLDPKLTNFYTMAEPLLVNRLCTDKSELREKVVAVMEKTGLKQAESYLSRYPHELSGGQRQRIAIAAAMILNPDFLVADEPVSMLDVSIRADILQLFVNLRDQNGVSSLFITHDLSLAWLISDRIAILYLGRIMEIGTADDIIRHPCNPYSQALLQAMPRLEPRHGKSRTILRGEIPNPTDAPAGCRFCSRCPFADEACRSQIPKLKEIAAGHLVACHHPKGI
jgi:peptide/nickel transport system ATP-binding protein